MEPGQLVQQVDSGRRCDEGERSQRHPAPPPPQLATGAHAPAALPDGGTVAYPVCTPGAPGVARCGWGATRHQPHKRGQRVAGQAGAAGAAAPPPPPARRRP